MTRGMKDAKANVHGTSDGSQHESSEIGQEEKEEEEQEKEEETEKGKRRPDFDAVDSDALVNDMSLMIMTMNLSLKALFIITQCTYLINVATSYIQVYGTKKGNLVRVGSWDPNEKTVVVDSTLTGIAPQLYPFQVDSADHCETPFEAYQDISLVLQLYAESVGKTKSNLSIYDPYFCAGSVVNNLNTLGYSQVYNKCEDFMKTKERAASKL